MIKLIFLVILTVAICGIFGAKYDSNCVYMQGMGLWGKVTIVDDIKKCLGDEKMNKKPQIRREVGKLSKEIDESMALWRTINGEAVGGSSKRNNDLQLLAGQTESIRGTIRKISGSVSETYPGQPVNDCIDVHLNRVEGQFKVALDDCRNK